MRPTVRELPAGLDLLSLKRAAPGSFPLLLESAARGGKARWDLLLAGDGTGLFLAADGLTRDQDGTVWPGRFLEALDEAQARLRHTLAEAAREAGVATGLAEGPSGPGREAAVEPLPFHGGWGLYLGYELAGQIEPSLRLPPFRGALPVAAALFCPAAVLRDRRSGQCFATALPGHEAWLHRLGALAATLTTAQEAPDRAAPAASRLGPCALSEDAEARFLEGVARVHDYLRAGDVFQVNLSRGWRARFDASPDPVALYAALRQANPAPFAGLCSLPGGSVASSSPERLVSIRGRRVETRPIAGTRPRFPGDDDATRIRELVGHPKERAEHVMLIDLERNDLGRICEAGSVVVDELMGVESYAHVHHIVSNVAGRLRPEVTAGQAIAAVFPGGTITGCPKVRCMQIIAELEGEGRGPYTGAMGYLDAGGDMDLNILIRSLWTERDGVAFRAGAGIVVDSKADKELLETRAKAKGMLRALGVDDDGRH